jgi:hypothetical protein
MEAVGAIADYLVHHGNAQDVSEFKEGGLGRDALHVIAGALGAGFDGGNILAGAAGAAAGEFADKEVQGAVDNFVVKNVSPIAQQLVTNLTLNVVAGIAGNLVGGSQGENFALEGNLFNRQLNRQESTALGKLIVSGVFTDPNAPSVLEAEACAAVECYAQIPQGSPQYQAAFNLYSQGVADTSDPEYQQETAAIKNLQAQGQLQYNWDNAADALTANAPTNIAKTLLQLAGSEDAQNVNGTGLCGLPGQGSCTIGGIKALPAPPPPSQIGNLTNIYWQPNRIRHLP